MANFYDAFLKFNGIEFNRADNILHKNDGENGLTYFGIYQSAHPYWTGWSKVVSHLVTHNYNRKRASISASQDEPLRQEVMYFYYMNFWLPLRLDEITSQKIAEEMFFFYIHIGDKKKAVRYAQSIIGEVVDGQIGPNTIRSLNNFDDRIFDVEYDRKEISHYKRLLAYNPKRFKRFIKGFINRAKKV